MARWTSTVNATNQRPASARNLQRAGELVQAGVAGLLGALGPPRCDLFLGLVPILAHRIQRAPPVELLSASSRTVMGAWPIT
jgi:hypothetical protein